MTVPAPLSLVEQMAATTARLRADRLARESDRAAPPRRESITPGADDEPETRYYQPLPYHHGYRPGARPPHYWPPLREPDLRTDRDRRRDAMEGPWFVPKRLPGP